jgi:hypothetical protein
MATTLQPRSKPLPLPPPRGTSGVTSPSPNWSAHQTEPMYDSPRPSERRNRDGWHYAPGEFGPDTPTAEDPTELASIKPRAIHFREVLLVVQGRWRGQQRWIVAVERATATLAPLSESEIYARWNRVPAANRFADREG